MRAGIRPPFAAPPFAAPLRGWGGDLAAIGDLAVADLTAGVIAIFHRAANQNIAALAIFLPQLRLAATQGALRFAVNRIGHRPAIGLRCGNRARRIGRDGW